VAKHIDNKNRRGLRHGVLTILITNKRSTRAHAAAPEKPRFVDRPVGHPILSVYFEWIIPTIGDHVNKLPSFMEDSGVPKLCSGYQTTTVPLTTAEMVSH
jgi:hypothetical protein